MAPTPTVLTFGQFLKQKRQAEGYTLEVIAVHMGYAHRSAWHRFEDGERELSISQLVTFAALCGVAPSALLAEYEDLTSAAQQVELQNRAGQTPAPKVGPTWRTPPRGRVFVATATLPQKEAGK